MKKMNVVSWVAFTGVFLVIASILVRILRVHFVDTNARTVMLVVGFTMMLLGTIWKVVLEMNDQNGDSSDSSSSD